MAVTTNRGGITAPPDKKGETNMRLTIINFCKTIEFFMNIDFDRVPFGHIGNVDVHKINGGYCLVDEYGKFKIIR